MNEERKKKAIKEWMEANQKLLKYQAEAYFAMVELLESYGMLDSERR